MTITLTGANTFLLKRELDALVQNFLAKQSDMGLGLERIDGNEADMNRLTEAIQGLPFLASRKLVVLHTAGANKTFAEKIETILANVPDITDVVLVEPKLDKRSSYYKYLKKNTDYREFTELDGAGLMRWLTEEAKRQGGSISAADARRLVDRTGNNQQSLAHELDKLLQYDSQITGQSIDLLTEPLPQSTIFNLLEAAFAGQSKRALSLYAEQRTQRVEPPEIVAMFGWQLRILAAIKAGGSRSADDIARLAKISPFVVKKSLAIARKLDWIHLKNLINELLTIDRRLKRESLDADELLRNFLLKVAQ